MIVPTDLLLSIIVILLGGSIWITMIGGFIIGLLGCLMIDKLDKRILAKHK